MDIPFSIHSSRAGKIVYRIHPAYRAFNFAVFAAITASVALYAPDAVLGWVCAAASLLGTLYVERWTFDVSSGLTYASGFFPLCPARRHSLADLSAIKVEPFAKGEMDQSKARGMLQTLDTDASRKPFFAGGTARRLRMRLILSFGDGQTFLVDETGVRSRGRLDALAAEISRLTGIPVEK